VVNIVTKSGGEQFHGDLFEYLRNGFFNAENHFSPRAPRTPCTGISSAARSADR
jgi:hypothetical protein